MHVYEIHHIYCCTFNRSYIRKYNEYIATQMKPMYNDKTILMTLYVYLYLYC